MLLYEYRVRDAFDRLRNYALRVRQMFEGDRNIDELRGDVGNLRERVREHFARSGPHRGRPGAARNRSQAEIQATCLLARDYRAPATNQRPSKKMSFATIGPMPVRLLLCSRSLRGPKRS